ncbi:hypothetical protein [Nonomuraea sp. NPDC005650]|uniref:hypothetical protein n=1 Tax=Nonomuraea sp. NPDC005650 TaxID=3157045 RepID=UPI0033A42E44
MRRFERPFDDNLILSDHSTPDRPILRLTAECLLNSDNEVAEEHEYRLLDNDESASGAADYLEKHGLALEEERRIYELEAAHAPRPCMFAMGRDSDAIEDFAQSAIDRGPNGQALISIMFCHPRSIVFRDLLNNFAYLDHRSGMSWDLIFAGYTSRNQFLPPQVAGIRIWKFRPTDFHEIRQLVSQHHRRALCRDVPSGLTPWEYSGTPELVSVMAYATEVTARGYTDTVAKIDWASLRAVRLTDLNGNYKSHNLGTLVETLSDWREASESTEPVPAFRELAPGEAPSTTTSVEILRPLLNAAAAAIAGGIAGNAAYDLLKKIMGM